MKYQRGMSLFDLVVFGVLVVLLLSVVASFKNENPELREGVVAIESVHCKPFNPEDDDYALCTIAVKAPEPGMVTGTQHILLLKEGEELLSSDEESE